MQRWEAKEKELEEILILSEIAKETEDAGDVGELSRRVEGLDVELDGYEIERMLAEENDKESAIVYINAGQEGPRPRTGLRCSSGCLEVGREKNDSSARSSISCRARRQGSRTSHSS